MWKVDRAMGGSSAASDSTGVAVHPDVLGVAAHISSVSEALPTQTGLALVSRLLCCRVSSSSQTKPASERPGDNEPIASHGGGGLSADGGIFIDGATRHSLIAFVEKIARFEEMSNTEKKFIVACMDADSTLTLTAAIDLYEIKHGRGAGIASRPDQA